MLLEMGPAPLPWLWQHRAGHRVEAPRLLVRLVQGWVLLPAARLLPGEAPRGSSPSALPSPERGCWHGTISHLYGNKAVISLDPQKPPGEIDGSPGQPLVTAA